ncbi:MAG: hypothetical protein GOMPHAMPRED_008252 [Gomphillus americanus]|uniref:Deacetylase sirtuin-type domain-containing protein n=1 Tax=Gomphillus americanus TaxID=1940652 RepID=A0A8H3F0G5_9LECA|nr:MAG: hypothetical protein GOMPHAMPRED_008252 [Gomphillus americanus]
MQKTFMRIPYTGPLPPPIIVPRTADHLAGAIEALQYFLKADDKKTVLLTGAGISVASGLADYRGSSGTYTLNKTYRPIYYSEFLANHEARKRYWARSFLGWTNLNRAKPNSTHHAIRDLGQLGLVSSVITQNVDSFHLQAHPELRTTELHGYLRSLVCVHCRNEMPRDEFQKSLSKLNPTWASFLAEMLQTGALTTEDPDERQRRGLKSNPDGDVDVPGAPYTTFKYPPCPKCLEDPPNTAEGIQGRVEVDSDGAWSSNSTVGVLKPAVIMFGESIRPAVKEAAEDAVDEAGRILVVGSSLATYSAWRLVKKAHEQGMPIGILNQGGVRGEEVFFKDLSQSHHGELGLRCSQKSEEILPTAVRIFRNE